MPSHSERVRRNYDRAAEPTGQRPQPSDSADWSAEDSQPVETTGPTPPNPLAHEDDSEAAEPNPI